MTTRINKPKVFLSHSWENKQFIEKIAADLRRCGIDYWLDKEEIRDGRPWLKMIFEDGIPTCDAVIVYLTEQSIRSQMVQKELDAAVVQQLSEGGVTLLPYVSEADIRKQLRSDIQTLQCREWNDRNYESILPTVVAEIWRSYVERTIETAVLQEKNRRLEQELDNKRLKEQYESSVFSAREEQEFKYLHEQLSKKIDVTFTLFTKKGGQKESVKVGEDVCRVSILKVVLAAIEDGKVYFDGRFVGYQFLKVLGETLSVDGENVTRGRMGGTIDRHVASELRTQLNTFGLTIVTKSQYSDRLETVYEFSEKMYRFKYWIEYNVLLEDEPLEHVVTLSRPESTVNQEQLEYDRATAQALKADKRISETRRKKTWSSNGEGTLAATKAVQTLFDDLKKRVAASNKVVQNIKLDFHADINSCSVVANGVALTMKWNCPSNKITDCCIRAEVNILSAEPLPETSTQQVFLQHFVPRTDNELQVFWHDKGGSRGSPYSLLEIADLCWRNFFSAVQRNEEENN